MKSTKIFKTDVMNILAFGVVVLGVVLFPNL